MAADSVAAPAAPVVANILAQLEAADRAARRAAKKRGHTTPLSQGAPERARPAGYPIREPPAEAGQAPEKRRRLRGKGPALRKHELRGSALAVNGA